MSATARHSPIHAAAGGAAVTVVAPTRICDNGGWTDTWFARYGAVLNIAVLPGVQVRIAGRPHAGGRRVTLEVAHDPTGPHPLLEAAVSSVALLSDVALAISVSSEMPAGASTGTSAAVTVALLAGLQRFASGERHADDTAWRYDIARAAHRVETEALGQQSGIQDQLASAFGGINFIEMTEYPAARVTPVAVSGALRAELDRRLALVYLGHAHRSSDVHEMVIAALADRGPGCRELEELRAAATAARDALIAGDLEDFGRALAANTDIQTRLHPDLVSGDAWRVIEIARRHGAAGWKVNGAGGAGGSVSLLGGPRQDANRRMLEEIEAACPTFRLIPIRLSARGVTVEPAS